MRSKHRIYILILNIILILSIVLILFNLYNKLNEPFDDAPSLSYTTESKIKVFTYATEMKEPLKQLLESLNQNNYSYEVVGYGEPWTGFRNRVNVYLTAVKKHREEYGDEAVVAMLDGYDCLCVRNSDSVYNSFLERPRSHIPVVFGVEVACMGNCNPDLLQWYTHHNIYGGEAQIKKRMRYLDGATVSESSVFLNGGMLMGRAGAIDDLYSGMLALNIEDDQICAAKYTTENLDKVDLDVEEVLFRNKLLERRIKLDDENGITGPGFLHFPGSGGKILDMMNPYKMHKDIGDGE
jgi:hypothetical protein